MSQISRAEAEALAAFIARARPDWDHPGIVAAIKKAAHCGTPLEIGVALCIIAKDRSLRTPALLAEKGRHWTQDGTPVGPNASNDTPCGIHRLSLPCRLCREAEEAHPIDPAELADLLAKTRAEVAENAAQYRKPTHPRTPQEA